MKKIKLTIIIFLLTNFVADNNKTLNKSELKLEQLSENASLEKIYYEINKDQDQEQAKQFIKTIAKQVKEKVEKLAQEEQERIVQHSKKQIIALDNQRRIFIKESFSKGIKQNQTLAIDKQNIAQEIQQFAEQYIEELNKDEYLIKIFNLSTSNNASTNTIINLLFPISLVSHLINNRNNKDKLKSVKNYLKHFWRKHIAHNI
ncbi:hypothetical protein BHY_1111 (plasmid) [Borrelia nietonii YOR]|uniref:Uncharacterized protein n=2 Tax=Borrelia TaxID=138 RepID=W5SAS5_9SPIR|nr:MULTISPECIES: hypothetical protein [Borrelia]AHH04062.1 hypothetical protein BHY_1111 [Borrelia nietonii YOR]AHH14620.1 hypothetical protein BHW_0900029 [Borrelia hermsii MTW]UPA09886.1 hypothetical protein bhYOR_001200 [Borrelia nietonii YOR]